MVHEREDKEIERCEREEPCGRCIDILEDLIDDKKGEDDDGERVRPFFVAEEAGYEHDLYDAVSEEVVNEKCVGAYGKIVSDFQDVVCEGAIWILDELSLGHDDGYFCHEVWTDKNKGYPHDALDEGIETLEYNRPDKDLMDGMFWDCAPGDWVFLIVRRGCGHF